MVGWAAAKLAVVCRRRQVAWASGASRLRLLGYLWAQSEASMFACNREAIAARLPAGFEAALKGADGQVPGRENQHPTAHYSTTACWRSLPTQSVHNQTFVANGYPSPRPASRLQGASK